MDSTTVKASLKLKIKLPVKPKANSVSKPQGKVAHKSSLFFCTPELPGFLDKNANAESIVKSVQLLGLAGSQLHPSWDSLFPQDDNLELSGGVYQRKASDATPYSSPSTMQATDSGRRKSHSGVDVHADTSQQDARPVHSSTTRKRRSPDFDQPFDQPSKTTHNSTKRSRPQQLVTAQESQSAGNDEIKYRQHHTSRSHMHTPANIPQECISPQLASNQHSPAGNSLSPPHHQPLDSDSPPVTSTSSKPSVPDSYTPMVNTQDAEVQTAPTVELVEQSCQAGNGLGVWDVGGALGLTSQDQAPFHRLPYDQLSIPMPAPVVVDDLQKNVDSLMSKAKLLKKHADKLHATQDKKWTVSSVMYYCLAAVRWLEADVHQRMLHRSRHGSKAQQRPPQLLEQTVDFLRTTITFTKSASGPPLAQQALLLLCRRLHAVAQTQYLNIQQAQLRQDGKRVRELLEQRAVADAKPVKKGTSPDADSASSTQDSIQPQNAAAAAAGGKTPPGSSKTAASGKEGGAAGGGTPNSKGDPTEQRVLRAFELMLQSSETWRATTNELQAFMKKPEVEESADARMVALQIFALGLDGGMGDILQTTKIAEKAVDLIVELSKAPEKQ